MLLDESHEGGLLEEDEHERLHSALSLAERTVEQIMIPRFQLVCLDVDATQEDILDMISGRPHTHIPIYEGNRESVIGMLHIKDMVGRLHGKRRSSPFALHAAPGAVRDGNADGGNAHVPVARGKGQGSLRTE